MDPTCRGTTGEVDQTKPLHATGGENMKMRYALPNIECEHCILQMVYRESVVFLWLRTWLGYQTRSPHRPMLGLRLARLTT